MKLVDDASPEVRYWAVRGLTPSTAVAAKMDCAAVSDRNGEVPFVYSPGNNDLFSLVVPEGTSRDTVPSVRLDDEWPVGGRRIAIKMDIEGHERTALHGMTAAGRFSGRFFGLRRYLAHAARDNDPDGRREGCRHDR